MAGKRKDQELERQEHQYPLMGREEPTEPIKPEPEGEVEMGIEPEESGEFPLQSLEEIDAPVDDGGEIPPTGLNVSGRVGTIGRIGKEEIEKARTILEKYKQAKAPFEQRIVSNDKWFRMRHWGEIRKSSEETNDPEPSSAWLFNSLANKHADAMDNYPEASVLPREENDKESAQELSSILPVVLEHNDYEQTYSDVWWQKLKGGTGVFGVFWNNLKNNGLGDIDIRKVDLLNLFWEPGAVDIQKSRNVFHVELVDNDLLLAQYPELENNLGGSTITISEYVHDTSIDTSEKSAVVDWYYKKQVRSKEQVIEGQSPVIEVVKDVLHYCKFCNGVVLYASENDENYADRGFYDHGRYPFVFDVMFPEEGSPAGFGYLDIMKETQLYIDSLDQAALKYIFMMSHPRWFVRGDGSVNEKEFANWTKPFIHVTNGNLGDDSLRQVKLDPLNDLVVGIRNNKIEELKETSGNRDFSQGGTTSGVTAASAIAALQEAGSKLSRDMLKTSYRSFTNICYIVLELIRQFYDEPRSFRILGEKGEEAFVEYDNAGIAPGQSTQEFGVSMGGRVPVFDIKVRAHKTNPFSKVAQNQLALEFYGAGFFNPQNADQALACIEMMDFEGKDQVIKKVSENGTLMQLVEQLQQQMLQMAAIVDAQNGTSISQGIANSGMGQQGEGGDPNAEVAGDINPLGDAVKDSNSTITRTAKLRANAAATPR